MFPHFNSDEIILSYLLKGIQFLINEYRIQIEASRTFNVKENHHQLW